jgi:hypothetical protein
MQSGNKALDTIDLIRGIWNLWENRKHWIGLSSGKRYPINKFVLGPLHTLHNPNGKLATKSWWYDPEYVHPPRLLYNQPRKLANLYQFESSVRKYLRKSNYSSVLELALILYTRALDLTNWEDSFLRLWIVLENLTRTSPKDNYAVTVRRASFIFGGEEYSRQVLKSLKDYRNQVVHAESESVDIEGYIYQLKRHVEALLEFLIRNKYGFKNLNDAMKLFDLPCDIQALRERSNLIRSAKQFLGHR